MFYTRSHEWLKVEEEAVFIGITKYLLKDIGDILYVDVPEIGKKIERDDVIAILESSKSAIEIVSPTFGDVLEVNTDLESINNDPENKGWLVKLKIYEKAFSGFMDEESYAEHIAKLC